MRHKLAIIHPLITLFLFLSFIFGQFVIMHTIPNSKVLGIALNLDTQEIIRLTNIERKKSNLPPLQANKQLTKAAQDKAADMMHFGYWDHYSPSKRTPWKFILDAGYEYHFAGENLAKDYIDNQTLINAWMDSPPHKANILNKNYKDIGIAFIQGKFKDKETILVVQMFGAPFAAADLQALKQTQEMSAPVLDSKLKTADEFVTNHFQVTKVMAFLVLAILLIVLFYDVIRSHRFRKIGIITKSHWGHIIFILALGFLIFVTKDGNIL
jgi:hypothetical protein